MIIIHKIHIWIYMAIYGYICGYMRIDPHKHCLLNNLADICSWMDAHLHAHVKKIRMAITSLDPPPHLGNAQILAT